MSLVLASIQGSANFPTAAEQMRRRVGARGGADRQDVLVAAHADVSSGELSGHAARFPYRGPKKQEGIREDGGR